MKRILLLLAAVILAAAACTPEIGDLKLGSTELTVDKTGGDRMVSVTSNTSWRISQAEGHDWCVPSVMSGKGSASVKISIAANEGTSRTVDLIFSADGAESVVLKVTQSGTDSQGNGGGNTDAVSPDPASGITVDPAVPDADKACIIRFNPSSGNPLYNHKGDLYAHLGVIVEGE